ncbi:MAG: flagellar motor protein MotD [Pseudomonadales bacterium]|nr:flagellar motor protein MotD [Pseudomonadales bacterium]
MKQRRRHRLYDTEEENHDRWLISYADFITLLFAFFVVMYSISSVNEGKYRVLSDALVTSFNSPSGASPIFDKMGKTKIQPILIEPDVPVSISNSESDAIAKEREAEEVIELNEISGQIEKQFYKEIENENISVKSNNDWIEVEIKSSLLFHSGVARLNKEAIPIIADLAGIIREYNNPLQVEGFTDDIPINNDQFSSNWELSSSRSVAVLEVLIKNGMQPENLAAIGYGEFQPIADNSTAEGRQENRRVVLIISRGQKLRRQIDTDNAKSNDDIFSKQNEIEGDTQSNRVTGDETNNEQFIGTAQHGASITDAAEINAPDINPPAVKQSNGKKWGIRLDNGGLLFTNDINPSADNKREQ